MNEEPRYCEKVGVVEFIDDIGQIHGSWGGCALIPSVDEFEIVSKLKLKKNCFDDNVFVNVIIC